MLNTSWYCSQISGPAGLVGIDANDKILYNIDLNPALKEIQRLNGGIEVGGAQDAVCPLYSLCGQYRILIKTCANSKLEPSTFILLDLFYRPLMMMEMYTYPLLLVSNTFHLIFESSSSLPNIIIDLKVLFWFKVKRF
jgi:hypothetical protein